MVHKKEKHVNEWSERNRPKPVTRIVGGVPRLSEGHSSRAQQYYDKAVEMVWRIRNKIN